MECDASNRNNMYASCTNNTNKDLYGNVLVISVGQYWMRVVTAQSDHGQDQ